MNHELQEPKYYVICVANTDPHGELHHDSRLVDVKGKEKKNR